MFIKLEVWEEGPDQQNNGLPAIFGSSPIAYLDGAMGARKVQFLPINIHCIQAYEEIGIEAVGRPAPAGVHVDKYDGLRLLLASGRQYVVIDGRSNFESGVLQAKMLSASLVHDHGKSKYGVLLGL